VLGTSHQWNWDCVRNIPPVELSGWTDVVFQFICPHINLHLAQRRHKKVYIRAPNLWHECPKWHAENFLVTWHSLLSQFLYCLTTVSILCPHTHIWHRTNCIWITVATKYHCSVTYLHKSERCKVSTGYLSLGRRSGCDWTNTWYWAERFTVCFCNRRWQQQYSYWHILLLVALLEEVFMGNVMTIFWINYNIQ